MKQLLWQREAVAMAAGITSASLSGYVRANPAAIITALCTLEAHYRRIASRLSAGGKGDRNYQF